MTYRQQCQHDAGSPSSSPSPSAATPSPAPHEARASSPTPNHFPSSPTPNHFPHPHPHPTLTLTLDLTPILNLALILSSTPQPNLRPNLPKVLASTARGGVNFRQRLHAEAHSVFLCAGLGVRG